MHVLRIFYDHELTERYKLQNEEKLLLSRIFFYTENKINVNRKTGLRIFARTCSWKKRWNLDKRILGKDLEVSAIGLGCMGMSHAYGKPSDKIEAEKLLEKAVELGCTFFDTAEIYGTADHPHHNEELVGEILKPYRNQIKIASKCGIRFDEAAEGVNKPLIPDGRPETIKKSIEGSLKRLQTDHLDLYYIHRIDEKVPIEETAGAMKELIEQGKITHWGLSEANEEIIKRAHKICPVTAIQNRYSMMYRDYETLFPVLEELNIGFVAFSPLANGFLTGKYDQNTQFEKTGDYSKVMPQFSEEGIRENEKLTEDEIKEIDEMLDNIPMSQVFGGSKVEK